MTVFLFTRENMDSDKPVLMVNLPHVNFIGGTTNKVRTVNIKGSWDPEILVGVVTTVGVPV